MGVFSDEIFNDIDNASSVNDFTLDNISKWFGVKIENGIIDQKSYKKMQRYFSHLNGVVIADIFNKFSQDKDGSKTFTSIFNEFKKEKNLTKFLFESVSVLPEKAISAFSFVFGKKHKIKDIEVPEQEIEEAISDTQNSDEVEDTIENIINQEVKTDEKKIKDSVKTIPNKSEAPNFNPSDPQNNLSLESDSEVNLNQLQKNKKENLLNNDIDNVIDNKQKNIKDIINKDINSEEFNNIDDITNNHIEHIEDSKFHISNVFDSQNDFSKPEIEINSKQLQENINEKDQVIKNKNNISNIIENELKDDITNYLENEDNSLIENNIKISKKLKNENNKVLKQLELFNKYSEENEVKKVIDKEVEQKQNIATTINEIKKDEIEEVLNNNIEDVSTTKQNFSVQEAVQEINEKQIEKNIEKTSIDVTQGINLNEEIEEIKENVVDNIKLSDINKNTQQIKEEIVNAVEKNSDEIVETKKIDAVGEVADKMKNTATKFQKKMKSFSEKHKTGVIAGGALVTLGLFFNLINRNRTVVHLEMNDQINQQEQGLNSRNNIQRRMGQYQINTNIRDTF